LLYVIHIHKQRHWSRKRRVPPDKTPCSAKQVMWLTEFNVTRVTFEWNNNSPCTQRHPHPPNQAPNHAPAPPKIELLRWWIETVRSGDCWIYLLEVISPSGQYQITSSRYIQQSTRSPAVIGMMWEYMIFPLPKKHYQRHMHIADIVRA